MKLSLTTLILLISLAASGAPPRRPPFPEPGEDAKFEPTVRLENADCQVRLERPVAISEGGHNALWYASDGSCRLTGDATTVARAAEKIAESLRRVSRYREFPDLLDFAPIGEDGNVKRDVDDVSTLPVFIAVRGPALAGLTSAATYVVQNTVSTRNDRIDGKDVRAWIVRFTEKRPLPRLLRPPPLSALFVQRIPSVDGWWYVNTRGVVRYRTQADFGPAMRLVENTEFPGQVLLNTLTHAVKRGKE